LRIAGREANQSEIRNPHSEMTMDVPFVTLVGTGNDFVLIDLIRSRLDPMEGRWTSLARSACRATGTDGLLLLERSRRADVGMRIFNPDGSEPSMCGNGIRCLAWYAHRAGLARPLMSIETRAGVKRARIEGGRRVRVDLGVPRLLEHLAGFVRDGRRIFDADLIDSGVPHLVCWVHDAAAIDVERLGRSLRAHRRFRPEGTNVDFAHVEAFAPSWSGSGPHRASIRLRTYERGVEAQTQACGTGAVATAAAFARSVVSGNPAARGRQRFEVALRVPGGVLDVELAAVLERGRAAFGHALLTGDVLQQSKGRLTWNGGWR
jgi:diaminopimelate epimerase